MKLLRSENKINIIQKNQKHTETDSNIKKIIWNEIRYKLRGKSNIGNRIFFQYLIILNIIIQLLPKSNLIEFKSSYITLKIKRKGYKNIFNIFFYGTDNRPNIMYINEKKQKFIQNYYIFSEKENVVKLEWNNNIDNFRQMLKDYSEIYEIDFSNFTPSKVIDMSSMFY